MAALGVDGLKLGGEVTQGLKQDDLFQFKEPRRAIFPEKATPILKPLNRPVRAVVMPLTDRNIAGRLMNAVRSKLRPLGNQAEATFFEQNLEMIHATVFHSSSHEVRPPCPLSIYTIILLFHTICVSTYMYMYIYRTPGPPQP